MNNASIELNSNVHNSKNGSNTYPYESDQQKSADKLQYLLSEMSREVDAQRGYDNSAEIKVLKERCQHLEERGQTEIIKNANAQETIRQLQALVEEQQATITAESVAEGFHQLLEHAI